MIFEVPQICCCFDSYGSGGLVSYSVYSLKKNHGFGENGLLCFQLKVLKKFKMTGDRKKNLIRKNVVISGREI